MAGDYISSEELQRHNADVFANKAAEKKAVDITEKDKVKRVLELHIKRHQTTKGVREELKKSGKTISGEALEIQFGISDGIVEILEKIKSELR